MPDDEDPIRALAVNVWDNLLGSRSLPDALMRWFGDGAEKIKGAVVQGEYAVRGQLDLEEQRLVQKVIDPYLRKHGKELQDQLNELADARGKARPFPFPISDDEFARWYFGNALVGNSPFPHSGDPDPWNRGERSGPMDGAPGWEERQMPGRGLDREFRQEQDILKRRATGTAGRDESLVTPYQHVRDQWQADADKEMADYKHGQQVQAQAAQTQRARNFTE